VMQLEFFRKVTINRTVSVGTLAIVALLFLAVSGCKKKEAARADDGSGANPAGAVPTLPANANPVEKLLFQKAPVCYQCAKANCDEFVAGCVNIQGVAAEGPAKGKSKAELCSNTLGCVLKEKCVKGDASFKCYCGKLDGMDCLSKTTQDGVCRSVIEAGLESTEGGTIAKIWGERTLGAGAAMALTHCMIDHGCKACF